MKSITGQIFSFTRQTTHTQSKSAPIQKFTTQQPLSDAQKRLRWLDISVVKNNGRAFEADQNLIVAKDAIFFPPVKCTNLHGIEKTFPDDAGARLKLMSFSFKHYGAGLVKAWTKPFNATLEKSNLPLAAKIDTFEICFIEYTFLAMAKGVFINSLKSKTPDNLQATTGFSFGGVRAFADKLEVPNLYTGYVYLVDRKNRVRWRGSGSPKPNEIELLLDCADKLSRETN